MGHTERRQSFNDIIDQEVTRYLSSGLSDTHLTILQWWKLNQNLFPHLSILAKIYLAIPTSSVPAERDFSLAGYLVSKKRS